MCGKFYIISANNSIRTKRIKIDRRSRHADSRAIILQAVSVFIVPDEIAERAAIVLQQIIVRIAVAQRTVCAGLFRAGVIVKFRAAGSRAIVTGRHIKAGISIGAINAIGGRIERDGQVRFPHAGRRYIFNFPDHKSIGKIERANTAIIW